MNLCLFGGTFDPIHLGHLIMAEGVLNEVAKVDKIIFIPAANPPHKNKLKYSGFIDRFNMVKKAITDNPKFAVSDIENQMEGRSFSIRTIKYFRREFNLDKDELFFLIGEDSLRDFEDWKQPEEIIDRANVLVVRRDKTQKEQTTQFDNYVRFLDNVPYVDISSSAIREKVKQKKSIKYLVPEKVEEYISSKQFYLK